MGRSDSRQLSIEEFITRYTDRPVRWGQGVCTHCGISRPLVNELCERCWGMASRLKLQLEEVGV